MISISCPHFKTQALQAAVILSNGRVIESVIDSESSVRKGLEASEAIGWQCILSQRATDRELSIRSRSEMDSALSVLRAEHELHMKQLESSHSDVIHGLQSQLNTLTSDLSSMQSAAQKAEMDLKAANEQLTKAQGIAKTHAKTNEAWTKAKDDLAQLQQTTNVSIQSLFPHSYMHMKGQVAQKD